MKGLLKKMPDEHECTESCFDESQSIKVEPVRMKIMKGKEEIFSMPLKRVEKDGWFLCSVLFWWDGKNAFDSLQISHSNVVVVKRRWYHRFLKPVQLPELQTAFNLSEVSGDISPSTKNPA